mgnify:CR=1 FL=1
MMMLARGNNDLDIDIDELYVSDINVRKTLESEEDDGDDY